jgi:hypothetical protein
MLFNKSEEECGTCCEKSAEKLLPAHLATHCTFDNFKTTKEFYQLIDVEFRRCACPEIKSSEKGVRVIVSVPKETGHGLVCLSANCGWRKSLPSRHLVPPAAPIPVGRQISRAGQSLVDKAGYELPNSRLEVERVVVRSRKFSPHWPPRRFWRASFRGRSKNALFHFPEARLN